MKNNYLFKKTLKPLSRIVILTILCIALISAMVNTSIDDFFIPGSQPGQSGNLETPQKCDNCHGGYDEAVEPAFNWRGSMMSQAARDPLFFAGMAIANQDAPESGDLCIRCHSPSGWLEGRSIPTDGSALNNNDRESVQCDFCHKLIKPTELGVNPYPNDAFYTLTTYEDDQDYLAKLSHIPPQDGNGGYIADNNNAKRGPFADANAKHKMKYSPFHQDAGICGTCHDVSNPVYEKQGDGSYFPNAMGEPSTTFVTYELFPVERTYSEWLMSDYNTAAGIYAPQFGGNKDFVSTCQDCHMKDVTGYGCNKHGVPLRTDLPLHDMTGGNTFIPALVAQLYPGEVDVDALNAGVVRARGMLQKAATMNLTCVVNGDDYTVNVEVINETGHKLPSGYPEGRRIWINLRAYGQSNNIVYESGEYDFTDASLIHDDYIKIYECKPGIGENISAIVGLDAEPSFHFVLNNHIYYDNRIPPRGFTNANFEAIQSPPVEYAYVDGQYWDNTTYEFSTTADISKIEATLYYQTLTKEHVEFLRDENFTNDAGQVMYDLWVANGKSEPEVMNFEVINMAPPVADFVATPSVGFAPLQVQFTDLSSNSPASWFWEFGDGNTSADQNPTHIYTTHGIYSVSLTATNSFGFSSASDVITVNELTQPVIFVQDMDVYRVSLNGGREAGECAVTVWDTDDNPVEGATVTATYDGPSAGTETANTDVSGIALLRTRAIKNTGGIWCFTVTDVAKAGTIYEPSLNLETTDCESGKSFNIATDDLADELEIYQIFPNPFTTSTTIEYELKQDASVEILIFNHFGQQIERVVQNNLPRNKYQYIWDAAGLSSGIYFVQLRIGQEVLTKKIIKTQ